MRIALFTPARCLAAALALAPFSPASARDGDIDPHWGAYGNGTTLYSCGLGPSIVPTLKIQPDGKPLMVGVHDLGTAQYTLCAARMRPNGTEDPSFGTTGYGVVLLSDDPSFASYRFWNSSMALQADGRILLAGTRECTFWDNCRIGLLVRLSATGRIEPNPNGYDVVFSSDPSHPSNTITAVALAPNGKIVVVGSTNPANSNDNYDFGIARFNADLSPDTSFYNNGTGTLGFDHGIDEKYDIARAVTVQADNKIVVAGEAYEDAGIHAVLVRLKADGNLDPGFGDTGNWYSPIWARVPKTRTYVSAVAIDLQGRILVAGYGYSDGSLDFTGYVVRLLPNGQFDGSFGGSGNGVALFHDANYRAETLTALALQNDGKIVVVGSGSLLSQCGTDTYCPYLLTRRLMPNGNLDPSFGNGGLSVTGFSNGSNVVLSNATSVAIGNGIFVGGHTTESPQYFGIQKLQLDGIFASGFER